MKMDYEKHNGWTNYETWLMNLNLSNDEGLYNSVTEFLKDLKGKEDYEKAQALKDWIEETFSADDIIKICDSWTLRDFQEIDWIEIIKAWESD